MVCRRKSPVTYAWASKCRKRLSTNKNLLQTNQSEDCVRAKRMIKDHLAYVGGHLKVSITQVLLQYLSRAHKSYLTSLKDKSKDKQAEELAAKK